MGDSSPITTRQTGADRLNPSDTPLRLEATVLDWAGTMVDFGSFAPAQIFVKTSAEFGVVITLGEARGPMSLGKWDHIRTLYNDGAIAARFSLAHGHMPTDDDVAAIYDHLVLLQIEKVGVHSTMIPGVLGAVAVLREAGLKISTCSGYPHVVMDHMIDLTAKAGYMPNRVVACDEVPRAHPWPTQALRCVVDLAIGDVAAYMKIDGAVPGIEEDRRVGMWTVALLISGNALGLPYKQYTALSADGHVRHHVAISAGFAAYRLHYEIDTIADLPEVVADINRRLVRGERPQCI